MTDLKKWYTQSGTDGDVVLSTRIRLARNFSDIPFVGRMTGAQRAQVEERVRDAVLNGNSALAGRFHYIDMEHCPHVQAVSLAERHLISPEFSQGAAGTALLLLEETRLDGTLFLPILKIIAISLIAKLGGDVCKDSGQGALASLVDMAGTVCALLAAQPLLHRALEILVDLGR